MNTDLTNLFQERIRSIEKNTKVLMELSYGKKRAKQMTKTKLIPLAKTKQAFDEKQMKSLQSEIWAQSDEAYGFIYDLLKGLADNTSYKIPGKYKNIMLSDIQSLMNFYIKCERAFDHQDFRKVARLELDTDLVELYMDQKLVKLLVKYEELYG